MKRVFVESPLGGDIPRSLRYARLCVLDSLRRGEAPLSMVWFLSSLKMEDPEVIPLITSVWDGSSELVAVYQNLGISKAMQASIYVHQGRKTPVEYRSLASDLFRKLNDPLPPG